MKKLNIPTLVILGVSVFCISEKHMEMALVIQRYWTGLCALLFLLWFSLPFSLGSRKSFPIEEYITYNTTYMHEYGHYIQSQMLGPLYTIPAISSGLHTLRNKGRTTTYNYWGGIPVSSDHWTETWANRLAAKYFGKYEDVDWERDRFRRGGRSLPLHIYYPLESFF